MGEPPAPSIKGLEGQDNQSGARQLPYSGLFEQGAWSESEDQPSRPSPTSLLIEDPLKGTQRTSYREPERVQAPASTTLLQETPNPLGETPPHRLQNPPFNPPELSARPQTPAPPVLGQIVERISYHLSRGEGRMELDLKPDSLGRLHVQITSDQRGIQAKFIAETAAVREVIETHMDRLRGALEEQGLRVDRLFVQVGENPWRHSRNGMPAPHDQESSAGLGEDSSEMRRIEAEDLRSRHKDAYSQRGTVDLFA